MRFARRLSEEGLFKLQDMTRGMDGNWWKDLLKLWRPSGTPAGEHGLRLAIRNGYMNFYFRGQSIAKVCFGPGGTPRVETHEKYVEDNRTGQKYAKLIGSDIYLPGSDRPLERKYEVETTLRGWIERAKGHPCKEKGYLCEEKVFVDELVGANACVIDLEMGLPACGARTSALRIDLVTLSKRNDEVCLGFREAKLINDARLRSHGTPEVFKQIYDYKKFLDFDGNKACVRNAYHETCKILIKLKEMAEGCGNLGITLHEAITEAAADKSKITISQRVGLVILKNGENGGGSNWSKHKKKLEQNNVQLIILEGNDPADRSLQGLEEC